MRPDFDRTATGWVWTDRLTAPWWRWRSHRAERRLYRELARPGESWRTCRARYRLGLCRVPLEMVCDWEGEADA